MYIEICTHTLYNTCYYYYDHSARGPRGRRLALGGAPRLPPIRLRGELSN